MKEPTQQRLTSEDLQEIRDRDADHSAWVLVRTDVPDLLKHIDFLIAENKSLLEAKHDADSRYKQEFQKREAYDVIYARSQSDETFYSTIIHSKEWKKWEQRQYKLFADHTVKKSKKYIGCFDVDESSECGLISANHWEAFCNFIRESK